MRRTSAAVVVAILCVAVAAPAFAQAPPGVRDPFEPLLQEQTTTSGTVTEPGAPITDGTVSPGIAPSTDSLPNTGMDTSPWLAASYALITFGAVAVTWS